MPVILAANLAAFEAPISEHKIGNILSSCRSDSIESILSAGETKITNSPFWWLISASRYSIKFGNLSVRIVSKDFVNYFARHTSRLSQKTSRIYCSVDNIRFGDS